MKLKLLVCILVSVLGMSYAQESAELPPSSQEQIQQKNVTEESILRDMTTRLSELVNALSEVRDVQSANDSAEKVADMVEKLYEIDYTQFEEIDEEVVAAGLADLFNDLELQVSRLYESDFFGNEVLMQAFGAEDETLAPPPGKDDDEPGDEGEHPDATEVDAETSAPA